MKSPTSRPKKQPTRPPKKAKLLVPAHATMPWNKYRHKEGDPFEFTHVSISGFCFVSSIPKRGTVRTGFVLEWACKGFGWGEITFRRLADGKLECQTECMGKDFVEAALKALTEKLVITE